MSVDQPTGIAIGYPKWIGRENRNVFGVAHTAITTKFIYSLKMDDRIQVAIMKEEGWVEGTKKLEVVDLNYSYLIKGFSIQEFMDNSLEENFELD